MVVHDSLNQTRTEPQIEHIINYALHMKRNGKAEQSIKRYVSILTQLSKCANLRNPEEIKTVLANLKWKDTTKRMTTYVLKAFYEYLKIPYVMPQYKINRELPFIPTEEELDLLIASSNITTATRIQILKETGARIGELDLLEWTHVDTQRKTIYITGIKGSNSRILPLSNKAISMLSHIERTDNHVFKTKREGFRKTFQTLRQRLTTQHNNPRLSKIHFHTFRHWKGTTEYHKTRDIYHVRNVLGHRNINNTLLYITLENALYQTANDEWICKTATNVNEASQLIENGFQYVTEMDGLKIFRKRK